MMVRLKTYFTGDDLEQLVSDKKQKFYESGFQDFSQISGAIELNPRHIVSMVPEKIKFHWNGKLQSELPCIRVKMVTGDCYDVAAESLEELHLKIAIDNGEEV